ncbi:CopC domain-containing protein [Micromonospora kangleipakensis]|uniref:CopC domain-containing protein n=1 Tax=Micromonospora kangleipakensis TaxID=1077942 RepID=A0A4Q8BGH9_9ACTN|nr:CopD family protein [Micromonospora kangleipakensis]RZU76329.1 CopC domain-containing protein [Micromonospora kangleipakensis]
MWLALFPALIVALGFASPAAAHFKLVKAVPADGGRVDGAVREIRLTFSAAGTPTGAGFKLSDVKGNAVPATSHTPDWGRTWLVHPTTPLTAGTFKLRWNVAAPDAHPLTGVLTFTVASPPPAPGATAKPEATDSPHGHAGHGGPGMPSASPPAHSGGHAVGHTADADQGPVRFVGGVGRWLSYGAILLGVGGLVFALTTLVGTRSDIRVVQVWVRAAGLTVAAGAALELAALAAVFSEQGTFTSAASVPALAALSQTPVAASLVLRFTGAAGLLVSGSLEAALIRGRHAVGRHSIPTVAAIATDSRNLVTPAAGGPTGDVARVRARAVRPVLLGVTVALLLGSFLLDGHTVTAEPRVVVVAADFAHTIAAAVWVGGVLLLAVLLLGRARLGAPTGAAEMAVRFSIPATAAVALTGVAGVALTLLILERPGHIVTTSWGRVLLVKVALVTVVALVGLYNSRRVVPRLDDRAKDCTHQLRRTVLVEAFLMLAVVLVTAILVNAET